MDWNARDGGCTHLGEGIEDLDEGGGSRGELGLLERIHHALDGCCPPAGLAHVLVVLADRLGVLDHQLHDAPHRAEEGDRVVLGELHRGAEQV